MARELCAAFPDVAMDGMARDARADRVLVDVRQNARRLTTVVPFSLRATPRPTASVPVEWDELDGAVRAGDARRLVFEAADVRRRIRERGDPLSVVRGQRLPRA